MKKLLFLSLFSAVISTATNAQTNPGPAAPPQTKEANPAAILQQMKEKQVPQMVEKTGISEAKANKVIELNYEMRMAAGALKDLSDADRSAKIQELKAAKEKKMSELLTADELAAVKKFYEDMGKNAPPRAN